LIPYHDKILKTPQKRPVPSTIASEGKFDHAIFANYHDTLTKDAFLGYIASGNPKKEMFDKIASFVPTIIPQKFLGAIRDNIKNFVVHEMIRWDELKTFFKGDIDKAWDYYLPIRTEYAFEKKQIRFKFRADIIFKIPENFYVATFGQHPACLRIDDYKTGYVPSFSCGYGWNGEKLPKPVIVSKVKKQLTFEALMIDIFKIDGYDGLPVLFGGVFYSKAFVYLIETITQDDKDVTLKDIVKLYGRLTADEQHKDFHFNIKWCKWCNFSYACTGALTVGDKMEIYKLSESQKKDKGESRNESMARQKRARQMLLAKVHELHRTIGPSAITQRDDEDNGNDEEDGPDG